MPLDDELPELEDLEVLTDDATPTTRPAARLVVPSLVPDENYVVRVRAQNELGQFSPWSDALQVRAAVDPNIPNPIRNLKGEFESSDAYLRWDPPSLSTGGEQDIGIAYYEVKIKAIGKVFTYTTTTPSFLYRFQQNLDDFGTDLATPSAQGKLTFSISAVNLLRKKSSPVSLELTNRDATIDSGTGGTNLGGTGVTIRKNTGSNIGTRSRLNFIEGSNITLSIIDDNTDGEIDITITASGGGTSHTHDGTGTASVVVGGVNETGATVAVASGVGSVAIGDDSDSTATGTIAVGRFAQATTNEYAIAVGSGDSASNAAIATGEGAIAIGGGEAGFGEHGARSSGFATIAIGRRAEAIGDEDIAIGYMSKSEGIQSLAIGEDTHTTTSGTHGIAIGYGSWVDALMGIAIGAGSGAEVYSDYGIAIGNAGSYGELGISIGSSAFNGSIPAVSSKKAGIAMGAGAGATEDVSIAIGSQINFGGTNRQGPRSTGIGSIAIGGIISAESTFQAATASGDYSIAIGSTDVNANRPRATAADSIAIGRQTNSSATDSVAIGHVATASGTQTVAIGKSATASSAQAVAIGDGSIGTSGAAVAIGASANTTSGINSIAVGFSTTASGQRSAVVGNQASVTHNDSVVLGNSATSDAANQIMLGRSSEHVKMPGGQRVRIRVDTGTTVTVANTDFAVNCNGTSGNQTVNLPSGVTGQMFRIKNIHATASVTIDPNGSQTIDGASTRVLSSQYQSVDIIWSGTEWSVF